MSFRQEHRARVALELLRQRLQVDARVLRDGSWQTLPAQTIVPGDVLHLRVGDLVPAYLRSFEGSLSIDQSTLTGESMPVDRAAGDPAGHRRAGGASRGVHGDNGARGAQVVDRQVLATRLAAIESAAGMDVLCTDKTGTFTQNRLRIAELAAYPPYTEGRLLMLAGLASDRSTQDPFDLACSR
ncbi:MAG TPA: hypothetical protein VNJ51_13750 [Candidatus Dormibacteraeota bacterium]|nr:hypothetical protein [Candidatus Dormibacteraeota bacterium]